MSGESFAPIFIPTLNRYQHLRQCLESLARCTGADQTEVYVALDYPPSEKYVEGWKVNKEFLENCGDFGFKKLHLIERSENYGTWMPGDRGNLTCLLKECLEPYDHYIITEDDNVFSPCFLEYMNKGFQRFEDDESVVALSGYRWFFPIKSEGNTFFKLNAMYTPWGMGFWKKKKRPELDYKWFRSRLTIRNLIKIYRNNGPAFVNGFIELSNSDKRHATPIDQHMCLYLSLEDKYCVCPIVSLVRNIGLDGSGVTMPINDSQMDAKYSSIPTSDATHFDFIGTGDECLEYNNRLHRAMHNWKSKGFYLNTFFKKWIRLIVHW